MKKCDCYICKMTKKITNVLNKKDQKEMAAMISELASLWLSAEMDRDYYSAILDGSWPQAEEILTEALKRTKIHAELEEIDYNRSI